MTEQTTRPTSRQTIILWLIQNSASGGFDAGMADQLRDAAQTVGGMVTRVITLPDEDLPTADQLDAGGVAILAVHTGDGTINTIAHRLGGWGGAILPLPGGTMNILARHLHGEDRDSPAIISDALASSAVRQPITALTSEDGAIWGIVGLFAGPTTAWGDVREGMRRWDVGGLIEAVPRALGETFDGAPVTLAGHDAPYPAIYVEPRDGQLRISGFTADGVGDLLSHSYAWLGGDFRTGPHQPLGDHATATITSTAPDIGLLVDGERSSAAGPIRLRALSSGVDFIATRAVPIHAVQG